MYEALLLKMYKMYVTLPTLPRREPTLNRHRMRRERRRIEGMRTGVLNEPVALSSERRMEDGEMVGGGCFQLFYRRGRKG